MFTADIEHMWGPSNILTK